MKLRDYQTNCIKAILSDLKSNDRSLCVLDTGLGKTVIFVSLIEQCLAIKSLSVLIIVRDVVLVKQTVNKFNIDGVGFVCGSLGKRDISHNTPVQVATIQTLVKKKELPSFNLIIVDECDSLSTKELEFINSLKSKTVGFTATPYDAHGFIYPNLWPKPCYTAPKEVTDKYLTPITLKGSKSSIDTNGVQKGNEYNLESASKKYTNPIIEDQLKDMNNKTHARKKIVIICCNIKHANTIHGIIGGSITHSKLTKVQQSENITRFTNGNSRFLITVNQVARGFDYPPIDCIVLMRPIRSYALMKQIIGRGRRLSTGKDNVLILDYGNVFNELGHVKDIDYNIRNKDRALKYKLCPMCENFIQKHIYNCECGFDFIKFEAEKRRNDIFKKQSSKSYTGFIDVTDIITHDYTSKKGTKCLKILFFSGLHVEHTEYAMNFNINKYAMNIYGQKARSFEEFKALKSKKVKFIKVEKIKGYKKVTEWIY